MKLWKENKLNQEWELDNKGVVKRFLNSEYGKNPEKYKGKDNALVYFITGKDGLNSSYDWEEKKGSIEGSKDILEMLNIINKNRTGVK